MTILFIPSPQAFLDDAEWNETLHHIDAGLRPDGYLAFEGLNPDDRAWERWNRASPYEEFDSPNGPMVSWLEVIRVQGNRVQLVGHNVFKSIGEVVSASEEVFALRGLRADKLTDRLHWRSLLIHLRRKEIDHNFCHCFSSIR